MKLLQYSDFKPHVKSNFKVKLAEPVPELKGIDLGPTELTIELVEAKDTSNDQCDSFSLIFHGPAERLLPQKTYSFNHEILGAGNMFLVPIGKTTESEGEGKSSFDYRYQAIFNRLKEQK